MTAFQFGIGPKGPWIQTGLGRVDVTDEELAQACEQHGIKLVTSQARPAFVVQALTEIHDRYAHGHDSEFLPDCAICAEEINTVIDWCRTNKPLEET